MKPIAVFQHTEVGAPGTVVPILQSLGQAVRVIRIVDGEPVPESAEGFCGLVFMGGYMGVHDGLPWIARELALIRDADARGLPVAGHCLGSQLVALALGGSVARHTAPEIGWQPLQTGSGALARDWWGEFAGGEVQTFQWHGDTFQPPPGALQIARSDHCSNQAFALRDRHLMLQSHLEMTPALVSLSLERNGEQLRRQFAAGNPAVSDPSDVLGDLDARTARMRTVLARLYARWVRGCA
ncbi:type 1 glutamine amidotransferase [Variovorax ureilyticus]|uniref:Type 1 glutamine amidotransferase n=1 Tax=Variovorax ureilyticus TaxID=1836198 RepID=A0ABU8VMH2_9BURK